jgi:flagellin-like hook-associated protein FlgL
MRINRAGDDAAGLAISEKMRGQIKGLNMATKKFSRQYFTYSNS